MEKFVINLPAMYGDHHVTEVRRILMGLPGVSSVFASSAFKSAEISFDPATWAMFPRMSRHRLQRQNGQANRPRFATPWFTNKRKNTPASLKIWLPRGGRSGHAPGWALFVVWMKKNS